MTTLIITSLATYTHQHSRSPLTIRICYKSLLCELLFTRYNFDKRSFRAVTFRGEFRILRYSLRVAFAARTVGLVT